jgi:hypothetical protein
MQRSLQPAVAAGCIPWHVACGWAYMLYRRSPWQLLGVAWLQVMTKSPGARAMVAVTCRQHLEGACWLLVWAVVTAAYTAVALLLVVVLRAWQGSVLCRQASEAGL